MKQLFICLFIPILLIFSTLSTNAQSSNPDISLHVDNANLKDALKQIESQVPFRFIYNSKEIALEKKITLHLSKKPLNVVLNQLLVSRSFSYKISGNNILLKKEAARPPQNNITEPVAKPEGPKLVKGRIENEKSEAMPGVTVRVQGTNMAVLSDETGSFQIKDLNNNSVLIFQYIGYKPKEITVAQQDFINVRMLQEESKLTEVVVTGVVQRSYESFTGAVTSINAQQLRAAGNQNIVASLQLLDPSFQVFQNNLSGSDPNKLPDIQLRGSSNLPNLKGQYLSNPNQPLFILDGFEVPLQKIMDLDMNRVEKITILKDATGTALYGSRGANGVVVVYTKQPVPGKLQVSYTGDFTASTPDLRDYHLLNGAQKLQAEKAGGLYTSESKDPEFQQWLNEEYNRHAKEIAQGVNTDWLTQPLRNSFGQRHFIYIDGGDSYFRYGVDLSVNQSNGVMKGSGNIKYSGGNTLSYRYKSLMIRNYLSVSQSDDSYSPYGDFSDYTVMNPYWRVRDANGKYLKVVDFINHTGIRDTSKIANPMYNGDINTSFKGTTQTVMDNFSLEWSLSRAFKLRSNASLYQNRQEANNFWPADHTMFLNYGENDYFRKGQYKQGHLNMSSYEINSYLDFNKRVDAHMFVATVGFDLSQNTLNNVMVTTEGYPNQDLNTPIFGAKYLQDSRPEGYESLVRRVSVQSNFNYTYNNRYAADLSLSTDGSSQFGTKNKFAPFYSVGAAWNVHNEEWSKKLNISYLKIRTSYGSTGTQNFPSYQAITTYQYFQNVRYLDRIGAYMLGMGNETLKWQQKNTWNIGADVKIFKDYLSFTANYYKERTQNQLIDLTIAPSQGFLSYKENVGEVENQGYEFDVRLMLIKKEKQNIFWSVNGTVFRNKNVLKNISAALKDYNTQQQSKQVSDSSSAPVQLYQEGQSMTAIFAVPSLGIDPANGREVFLKQDGSRTYIWDAADKRIMGDELPKYRGIFGTTLMYKGITASINFEYQLGGQTYNQTLVDRVENADLRYNVDIRVLEERWQKPGDHTFFKNIADKSKTLPTSRFVQNNNQLNCKLISLQYDFLSSRLLKRTALKTLKASFYMIEPFRITSIKQERGLAYPFAQSYSLGIQTSF
ncbi:SusC/RagA family TonB-linked outer membrane protein [Chitinophaga silvatica]|nr:SusC/RagA family TonB-linked outer membrane protein [Chitinophaga silvatica]